VVVLVVVDDVRGVAYRNEQPLTAEATARRATANQKDGASRDAFEEDGIRKSRLVGLQGHVEGVLAKSRVEAASAT